MRTAVSVGHACAMMEEGPLCIIDALESPDHVGAHVGSLLLTWVAPGEKGQPTSVSSAAPAILQVPSPLNQIAVSMPMNVARWRTCLG